MTLNDLRNQTYKKIEKFNKEKIAFDYLIFKYSNKSKIDLILSNNEQIKFNIEEFNIDLDKYLNGMPIQKIVGQVNFANLKIDLSQEVLIPRLETEELIFKIKKHIKGDEKVLDICAGSGFIGLALKQMFSKLKVVLSDNDKNAIKQIKINKRLNNLNVKVIKSNLFENIKEKFDVIICNPPYISFDENIEEDVLKYEPFHALFAKDNGLYFYKKIIPLLKKYLMKSEKAKVFFEIGEKQGSAIKEILNIAGFECKIKKDINNKDRFIYAWPIF